MKYKAFLTALGMFLLWFGFQTYAFGFVALSMVVLATAKGIRRPKVKDGFKA